MEAGRLKKLVEERQMNPLRDEEATARLLDQTRRALAIFNRAAKEGRRLDPDALAYGSMAAAIALARAAWGAEGTIDWLRNTADLQERYLLEGSDGAPPALRRPKSRSDR